MRNGPDGATQIDSLPEWKAGIVAYIVEKAKRSDTNQTWVIAPGESVTTDELAEVTDLAATVADFERRGVVWTELGPADWDH